MKTETLLTPYGMFSGITEMEHDSDGSIRGVRLGEQNVILTHAGELIPFYGEDSPRRKYKASVTFHKNGMIKAVSLEEQQDVETPIGELPAELITFYETGEIKRVFPVDGKISGYWTEEDEQALNIPLSFDVGCAVFTTMLSGICFYKSGQIRSMTLYPKEVIEVTATRYGVIPVRQGFSLYEDGALESLEPAEPIKLATPAGTLTAYDVNAHGINADSNSLVFDREGRIMRLVTSADKIVVRKTGNQAFFTFAPKCVSPEDDGGLMTLTVGFAFNHDTETVCITDADGDTHAFSFEDSFMIISSKKDIAGCTEGACSDCSSCKHHI